jgi:hypothetical protein
MYSEMCYPKARFVDNVEDQELIARAVPFGRLGARKRLARSSFRGNEEAGDAAPERIGRSRKVQAG